MRSAIALITRHDVEDRNLGGKLIIKKAQGSSYDPPPPAEGRLRGLSQRRRGDVPQDITPPGRNSQGRWWYTWKYLDQIREFIKVPMLAKGIITPEDAELCIQHGLDGVYVSNHGGRALCYEPSTIEVLPDIVAAVRGRVPVLFDSGVDTAPMHSRRSLWARRRWAWAAHRSGRWGPMAPQA